MKKLVILFVFLSGLCPTESVAKPERRIDIIVPKSCILSDIHMYDCSLSNPHKCKTARVEWNKECEILQVN